jgi:hypothetical protein
MVIIMLRFRNMYYGSNKNIQQDENEKILEEHILNQYLTLEDICPIWSNRLKLGLTKKDMDTMARDSKYCLVGEAWGFTGKHAGYYLAPLIPFIGCWTCVKYGNKMGKIARRRELVAINLHSSDLEPIITEFLKHWNERHRDVTEKLRKTK